MQTVQSLTGWGVVGVVELQGLVSEVRDAVNQMCRGGLLLLPMFFSSCSVLLTRRISVCRASHSWC